MIDGVQAETLTASATGFVDAFLALDVEDDDTAERKTIGGRFEGVIPSATYEVTFDIDVVFGNTLTIEEGSTFEFVQGSRLGIDWISYPSNFGVPTVFNANGTPADNFLNLSVDPLFQVGTLFRVQDTSPVNDAGTGNGSPPDDYLGAYRHVPIDIGAYEHDPVTNVVTTLIDENDGGLGMGSGNSLREVLTAANGRGGPDTITFDPSLWGGVIVLNNSPLPAFANDTEILGPGASLLTISGNAQTRIFTVNPSVVVRSTLSDNHATSNGGGIYNNGNAMIRDATIDGNTSGNEGGGVFNAGNRSISIFNSTVSGNSATWNGGGIANRGNPMTILQSTISGNVADSERDGRGAGGGIAHGVSVIHNTIIAGNTRQGTLPSEILGLDSSGTHNLIGDAATSGGLQHGQDGNVVGVDAKLAPLQFSGGPTKTHPLESDSPAIDAGDNVFAVDPEGKTLVSDQRSDGYTRFVDGNRSGTSIVDIFAFQTLPAAIVESIVVNSGDPQRSMVDRVSIQFDQPVDFDSTSGSPFAVVNLIKGQAVEVVAYLAAQNSSTLIHLNFVPGPAVSANGSLVDGEYRLTLRADRIRSGVMTIDENGDGVGGDDKVFGANAADRFFRFFGDSDGDRDVDAQDYGRFGQGFLSRIGSPRFDSSWDSDGDGDIDGIDYGQFGRNFGKQL